MPHRPSARPQPAPASSLVLGLVLGGLLAPGRAVAAAVAVGTNGIAISSTTVGSTWGSPATINAAVSFAGVWMTSDANGDRGGQRQLDLPDRQRRLELVAGRLADHDDLQRRDVPDRDDRLHRGDQRQRAQDDERRRELDGAGHRLRGGAARDPLRQRDPGLRGRQLGGDLPHHRRRRELARRDHRHGEPVRRPLRRRLERLGGRARAARSCARRTAATRGARSPRARRVDLMSVWFTSATLGFVCGGDRVVRTHDQRRHVVVGGHAAGDEPAVGPVRPHVRRPGQRDRGRLGRQRLPHRSTAARPGRWRTRIPRTRCSRRCTCAARRDRRRRSRSP